MSLLSFLLGEKKKTAAVAKERLQIILAHERSGRSAGKPDYLPALQLRQVVGLGRAAAGAFVGQDDLQALLGHAGGALFLPEQE